MPFNPTPGYTGRREDPDDPIYDLADAVSVLKNRFNKQNSAALNEHLAADVDTLRGLLADVIHHVYDDWMQSHQIRKTYAGYAHPHSKLEKATWRLSMQILNKPHDDKPPVERDPRDHDEPKDDQ